MLELLEDVEEELMRHTAIICQCASLPFSAFVGFRGIPVGEHIFLCETSPEATTETIHSFADFPQTLLAIMGFYLVLEELPEVSAPSKSPKCCYLGRSPP